MAAFGGTAAQKFYTPGTVHMQVRIGVLPVSPYLFVIPVFLVMIAFEMLVARRRGLEIYRLQDTVTSINIGIVSQFVNTIGGVISVTMYALMVERFGAFEWDTRNPLTWVLAVVLYDFFYYWVHRSGHEVNILWAAHVVHHSSEEFNLSTAMRQSSTGFYFRWVFYIPLALLGFPLKVFMVAALIDYLYQAWVHTQLVGRLGVLEWFLVTPSNHRVHHGQNDYCIDRNYGGIFSVWDRMFGTYADERVDEKPVYGTRKPFCSWNPVWGNIHHYVAIFHQAKATPGWRDKLMCFFAAPSWTPQAADRALARFEASRFTRFSTPAPRAMRVAAVATTILSIGLLMHFLSVQPHLGALQRIGYSATMVLGLCMVGWVWLHPRVVGQAHA